MPLGTSRRETVCYAALHQQCLNVGIYRTRVSGLKASLLETKAMHLPLTYRVS